MSDDRLSPSQAAAYIEREWYLKVHPDTVRRWVDQGRRCRRRATRAAACSSIRRTCTPIFDVPSEADGND